MTLGLRHLRDDSKVKKAHSRKDVKVQNCRRFRTICKRIVALDDTYVVFEVLQRPLSSSLRTLRVWPQTDELGTFLPPFPDERPIQEEPLPEAWHAAPRS